MFVEILGAQDPGFRSPRIVGHDDAGHADVEAGAKQCGVAFVDVKSLSTGNQSVSSGLPDLAFPTGFLRITLGGVSGRWRKNTRRPRVSAGRN